MNLLSHVSLTQFRNFAQENFSFDAKIIGITGKNGTGKTNLLDAIYYLCFTKSYFQNKEINNVQNGKNGFRIEGKWSVNKDQKIEQTATVCKWKEGKKELKHDGIPYEKITDHLGKFIAVMIAPDDIAIINGGSEIRRKFIDGLLSQTYPEYLNNLLAYQRCLQQKNAYLKTTSLDKINFNLLDVYDEQLAVHGEKIMEDRMDISKKIPLLVEDYYHQLSNGKEEINIVYRNSTPLGKLHDSLKKNQSKDLEYRRTTIGPHMEDWLFTLNDNSLKTHASQGQKKSFLISLKLAQLRHLQDLQKTPILLLDDIFEKLDHMRLGKLFELLRDFSLNQIFLTHTNSADFKKILSEFYEDIQVIHL